MSDLSEVAQVEQTLSELIYLVENEGKLKLESFYGVT